METYYRLYENNQIIGDFITLKKARQYARFCFRGGEEYRIIPFADEADWREYNRYMISWIGVNAL